MVETLYRALLQRADIGQSRSSSLNPLQWALAIFLGGLVGLLAIHAPLWLVVTVSALLVLIALLMCGAYLYFMKHDPDALRSENYSLSKIALSKGLVGDDLLGLHEPTAEPPDQPGTDKPQDKPGI